MCRISSSGMCKEYKNGNITIKFDPDTVKEAKEDNVSALVYVLGWFDCYFIGETYCLSNVAIGHSLYNAHSDLVYVFDWGLLDMLKAGKMVRLYARKPDEFDREILEKEGY